MLKYSYLTLVHFVLYTHAGWQVIIELQLGPDKVSTQVRKIIDSINMKLFLFKFIVLYFTYIPNLWYKKS